MSPTTDLLTPHLTSATLAAAAALSFASLQAGNLVAVDDPTPALPLGDVRLVRAELAEGLDLDIVIALTDVAATDACGAAGTDDLGTAVAPGLLAMVTELRNLAGMPVEIAALDEVPPGSPWGPPGTQGATAGLFVDGEQVGNIIFLFPPEPDDALQDPGMISGPGSVTGMGPGGADIAVADFPDADHLDGPPGANPLSLLRGVEMRVTAELGRAKLPVSHLLDLGPGAIVELDRVAGTPVDVVVNGTIIARGEVVVIDEEYGVRITEIVGLEDSE
jgi:flagellar motor switch protein FliN